MSQNTIDVNEWLGERWENLKRRVRGHFEEYDFSRRAIAHNISLIMILLVALTVRLFPLMKGWDPTIKAFDPMWPSRQTISPDLYCHFFRIEASFLISELSRSLKV